MLVSAAPQPAARALGLTTQGQNWKEDDDIKHILDSIREGVKKLFTKSVRKGCMYVTPPPPLRTNSVNKNLTPSLRHSLMKRTKLVKKKPIQMQVINGMFWGGRED